MPLPFLKIKSNILKVDVMNKFKLVSAAIALLLAPSAALAQGEIRGLEHIAITVPDMTQAKDFFINGLGCKFVLDLGPFKDEQGTWMQDAIGTHKDAVMYIGEMQCGNATNVELMEISSPTQNKKFPTREDFGASSLGFYTDDLKATIARVLENGGAKLGSITSVAEGPLAGRSFIYVTAPWGQQIFLMNDGDGIAYSKQDDAIDVFSPADIPAIK